jgi:two-component system sensor histidine kinase PilS (NtrC family)
MDRRRIWYTFRAFNFYRLTLTVLLLALFLLDPEARFLGKAAPRMFLVTAVLYLTLVLLAIAGSYWRRPPLSVQAHLQTLIDLMGLGLLIHASGGVTSSLSILLVTAIAASGILLPLRSVLVAAALAFFILLGIWLYDNWTLLTMGPDTQEGIRLLFNLKEEMVRLGILGASCFLASLLTYTLAENTRRSEILVRQRSHELLSLAGLNQAIIQRLQSGIIVVDYLARIRLLNDMARDLLNYQEPVQGLPLQEISAPLSRRLDTWLRDPHRELKPFRQAEHLPDIIPKFSHLTNEEASDILIFLENSAQVAQRLQQIKLAALGRLTASIAHEIRNPLGSISHAAQLLAESPNSDAIQRRLGQIIHDNSKRANRIITNVQDLSRRDRLKPENIQLLPWLQEFCREFIGGQGDKVPTLELEAEPEDIVIHFDPSHLQQVLWNLCSNACVHGTLPDQTPQIRLLAGQLVATFFRPKTFLEVIDSGPGIAETDLEKIFEPFFTTKAIGTGLGLYIAREMCEANGAQLQYLRIPEGGSCFRITFATINTQEQYVDGPSQRPDRR